MHGKVGFLIRRSVPSAKATMGENWNPGGECILPKNEGSILYHLIKRRDVGGFLVVVDVLGVFFHICYTIKDVD